MTVREIEKILRADGWFKVSQVGSHRHFEHHTKTGKVTVPVHKDDINIKTARMILKQAGITYEK